MQYPHISPQENKELILTNGLICYADYIFLFTNILQQDNIAVANLKAHIKQSKLSKEDKELFKNF